MVNHIASHILSEGHKLTTKKHRDRAAGFKIGPIALGGKKGSVEESAAVTDIGFHLKYMAEVCGNDLKGIPLLIDNAASWRTQLPDNAPHNLDLKNICNTLNDEFRINYKKPVVQTIFAGLPGTVHTITALTSERLMPKRMYHLQNITNGAAYQIITDHLHLEPPLELYKNNGLGVPDPILQAIARECRGHIWHANATGQELQKLLQTTPTADGKTMIQTARNEVYRTICKAIPENHIPLFRAFALASLLCHNRIPVSPILDLLQTVARSRQIPFQINQWKRKGLLETFQNSNNYAHHDTSPFIRGQPGHEEQYTQIPVPSLAAWFLEKYGQPDAELQKIVQGTFPHGKGVAPWRWRAEPRITPIPELPLPQLTPTHPWTGNAPEIYMLQPQDNAPTPQLPPAD